MRYNVAPKQLLVLIPLSNHAGHAGHKPGHAFKCQEGVHGGQDFMLAGQP